MLVLWPIHNLKMEYSQYPGVMNISALLKQNGIKVEVISAEYETIIARLRTEEDVILAFSTPTPYYRFYLDLNRKLKQKFPSVLSVFGGPHPTFFPEMIEEEGIDVICVGEGEEPMLDLVQNVTKSRPIKDIKNLWVKENGHIYRNEIRPLVEDLDSLPLPDHNVFSRAMSSSITGAVVVTSRGCPHKCTYCYNHVYNDLCRGKGKPFRRRSVDHVMQELLELKAAGCQYIRFMDDLFILSKEWIGEFAGKYREEISLPFTCLVRANFVTEEIVTVLKKAGCYRMMLGVEAGNDFVRNTILKRKMDKETILKAARLIKGAGMKLVTANILAIPGGSFEADWETLQLNIQCKADYASAALLHPFPKTEIYDFAKAEGMIFEEQIAQIESSFNFGLTSPLKFDDLREKRRMENLQKFFPLTVRLPWLAPLVRRLVELPQNKLYNAIYMASVNVGMHFCAVPPSVGRQVFWRKIKRYQWFKGIFNSGRRSTDNAD
jgi:radical SAM superfamily enzyme YgiQ (UPF0313 family)